MSSDELRQAAATLRERAEAATHPGYGWRLGDTAGANEVWAPRDPADHDAFMIATTATRLNPAPGVRGYADADYIAMMHPGVGLALADWLDVEAGYQWTTSKRRSDAALAVARLINGSAS